LATPQL